MINSTLRSWVEISRKNLINNYYTYKAHISNNMNIMAVVKADAYGHGDCIIGKVLSDSGVHYFAVSNIDEAIHIRIAGVEGMILILGYTPTKRANELLQYDITQALLSEDYAERITELNLPIKCQFAIDTGMRRIGLNADDTDYCEHII